MCLIETYINVATLRSLYYQSSHHEPPAPVYEGPTHFIGHFTNYSFDIILNRDGDNSHSGALVHALEANPHFIAKYWLPM